MRVCRDCIEDLDPNNMGANVRCLFCGLEDLVLNFDVFDVSSI
jgi:hypothetical protein